MRLAIWLVLSWGAATAAFASQTAPYLPILMSVQDNEGRVWGVEAGDARGEKLWIWRDGGTSPQVKNANWPGSVGALIAAGQYPRFLEDGARRDPNGIVALGVGPDGRMWSWWETLSNKDDNVDRSGRRPIHRTRRLHAYRHDALGNAEAAGEWAESWEVPANELWRDPQAWKSTRLVWIGADAWILRAKMGQVESESGGGAVLQHLPSGKPEVITYPLPALDVRAFRELNMEVDAWRRIWLWGRVDAWPRKEVCFFGTFIDGTFDFSPRIADLPEGEITSLVMDSDKRGATVAVKSKGLWHADFERMAVTSRLSPSLQPEEEVVSWQSWPDGAEVLLARSGGYRAYWGTLWVCDARGWHKFGNMSGELGRLSEPGVNPAHASRASWSRTGQTVVLSGAGDAWGLSLSDAKMRKLDWRVGYVATRSSESYPFSDGKLWIARPGSGGRSVMTLTPEELVEALSREPSVIEYWENSFAVDDGGIWTRSQVGPDQYETRLWRAGRWAEWAEPDVLPGLFAMDSLGRVWRYSRMDTPAALLDPDAGSAPGYRLAGSLRELLEREAGGGRDFLLRLLESHGHTGDAVRAVVRHGRALVWRPHRFELWRDGTWTELPDQPGGWPTEMGFDSTGRVRVRMENPPVRIWDESGGSWKEADGTADAGYSWQRSDLAPKSPQPSVPDWFLAEAKKRGSEYSAPSCFQDASGDWWAGSKAGLLRGRSGRVWPAIRSEIPDPWRQGREYAGRAVRMQDGGMQFWAGDTVTLVPAAALAEAPGDGE